MMGAVRVALGVTLFVALAGAVVVGTPARLRPDRRPSLEASPTPGPPPPPGPPPSSSWTPAPSPAAVKVSPAAQVAFPSAAQGWVIAGGQLLTTLNGGRTFTVEKVGAGPVTGIDFLSPTVGWAVTSTGLAGTIDAGQSWTPAGEPSPALAQVSFWGPKDGLGLAADDSLWRSNDGGLTWKRTVLEVPAEAVCAVSATAAWVVAAASVYRSTDGGSTWQSVYSLPQGPLADAGSTVSCSGAAVWADFNVATAGGNAQVVIRSLDDGATWAAILGSQPTLPGVTPLYHSTFASLGPMALVGPGTACFSGIGPSGPATAVTGDSGATLNTTVIAAKTLSITGVTGMAFADQQHGWALAASGTSASLLETTDGGGTWSQVAVLPG